MFRKVLKNYFFIVLGSVFLTNSSYAYEPPIVSVKEALLNGQVAFIGRIIRIDEVQRDVAEIIGEVYIQLYNCYYGLNCGTIKTIKMRYVINTLAERTFPVEFNVSDEILIVLNKSISSNNYFFSSDIESGMDFAFIIMDSFPENYSKGSKTKYLNIYRTKLIYNEANEDINKWVRERAAKLIRK